MIWGKQREKRPKDGMHRWWLNSWISLYNATKGVFQFKCKLYFDLNMTSSKAHANFRNAQVFYLPVVLRVHLLHSATWQLSPGFFYLNWLPHLKYKTQWYRESTQRWKFKVQRSTVYIIWISHGFNSSKPGLIERKKNTSYTMTWVTTLKIRRFWGKVEPRPVLV